ncbi:hypothetical protein L1277_000037 [Okibacterium sp. HSC-33S16]|uniref:hypothetical protein n=1 Tax=Okibacterium sp. HSC-33S16 TaxID=2910965 RepID=UPI0020A00B60|nr:hypothetical protein [Okibacterium sp. HSC-33S16]MCP2029973.1 hypothetical protein [Okibacterium sp. HSC-33S16]
MSKHTEALTVGGVPRADLLPFEIRAEHKGKRTRRSLIFATLGVVLLVFVATGTSFYFMLTSQMSLASEQVRTTDLLAEQQKYSEVRVVQDTLSAVEAGQMVGAATEIDWKAYLDLIEASLPANVAILEVAIDGASPLVDFGQPSAPLQGMRVATLTFGAATVALPDTDAWLVALSGLPGYADANPDSIVVDEETGLYKTTVTMHIGEGAWSQRFVPEEDKVVDSDEASDAEGDVAEGGE